MSNCLIIFTKNLELGKVKTRLAKDIGNEQALYVYENLLEHTHDITKKLECNKCLFYSVRIERNDVWRGNYEKHIQQGKDLGERMKHAFHFAFNQGHEKVIIIGSDCFELTSELIENAFQELDDSDFVIGPAKDGGYYLLGMKTTSTYVFEDMQYSTREVLKHTLDKIYSQTHSFSLLKELRDVDTIEDLSSYPQLLEIVKIK